MSGHGQRLAFAIAITCAPEILLIDEVIGVGDAAFFNKAFDRLQRLAQQSRILFIASQADGVLRQLCDKAIWLHHGSLMQHGQFMEILTAYRQDVAVAAPSLGENATPGPWRH